MPEQCPSQSSDQAGPPQRDPSATRPRPEDELTFARTLGPTPDQVLDDRQELEKATKVWPYIDSAPSPGVRVRVRVRVSCYYALCALSAPSPLLSPSAPSFAALPKPPAIYVRGPPEAFRGNRP